MKSQSGTKLPEKNNPLDETISRLRELAWTGQHARLIEQATQGLSMPKIKIALQMDLLDLRSESYIAQGKFDLAAKDAATMLKLANTINRKPTIKNQKFIALALNRKALIQMREGELAAALKTATQAEKHARTAGDTCLLGASLLRLGEAQTRIGQNSESSESAQQVIQLCKDSGDLSSLGRAWWIIAMAESKFGHAEASRRAAQTALELCQQAGDQYGIGNALNVFTFTDMDIAERIKHLQQASRAFETAGYIDRQAVILSNLSLAYMDLGLYPHAHRIAFSTLEMNRWMGTRLGLAYALGNLSEIEIRLGLLDSGRRYGEELIGLVPSLGDPDMMTSLEAGWGLLALVEGNPKTAIKYFKSAVEMTHQQKKPEENIFLTNLAQAYLANGNHSSALEATRRATAMHRRQGFAQPNGMTAQEIWWRHTQALLANKQIKPAREALERAYGFLLAVIANVRDEGLRRNVLNKVEANSELLQFWVKDGHRRKLPKEQLFAHLAIESSLREPFQRLADTGLRLNALHSTAEIQTFLVEEATELSGAERVLLILEKDGGHQVVESAFPYLLGGKGDRDAERLLRSVEPYLKQARLTRAVQLQTSEVFKTSEVSRIIAPLIAQNQVTGYLYVDMDSLYGSFNETDRDMLGMLANQGAVALDNAQWTRGLEQKVAERTEELNARVDELAILNSVGEAMAKTLDVKTVTKIVGDKVRDIFHAEGVSISLLNAQTNLIHNLYEYDAGEGGYVEYIEPFPLGKGLTTKVIQTRRPLLLGSLKEQQAQGAYIAPEMLEKGSGGFTESMMMVPIVVGMQVLGVAAVTNYKQNAFDENDLRLLQTLSANMGVAIQNARLFEAEQQRVAELAILNSIGDAMSKTLDVDTIVHIVGDKVREIFHTEVATISLYDPKSDLVSMVYSYDKGRSSIPAPWPLGKGGLTAHVIRNRQPLMINTDEEGRDLGWFPNPAAPQDEEPTHSYLGVPIIIEDQVIGVVSVQDYQEHAYDQASVRLLSTLATNMGVAIKNAQLFDAEQQRVAELQIINSIQQGVASELNFQSIVNMVGDKLREVFHTPDLGIQWYDEKTNLLQGLYTYEHGKPHKQLTVTPKPDGSFNQMRKTRKPIVWHTKAEADAISHATYGDASLSGVHVPIISGDRVLGTMTLENYERENVFGESEIRVMTTVAAALGSALENAHLFDETQRLLKETEQRNAELAIINEVQHGLAAELNFQAIVDLVGDRLRQVFTNGDIGIRWYDPQAKALHFLYEYEHGVRISIPPQQMNGDSANRFEERRTPLVLNDLAAMEAVGLTPIPGTDQSLSIVMIPIIGSDRLIGQIDVENYERENAYSEADVRLLQTVAGSMGVALENARLFDETQRLLKETEQRNNELLIINRVGQGLARQLEFQSIIDLVGDEVARVFPSVGAPGLHTIYIALYDGKTNLVRFPYFKSGIGGRISIEPETLGKGLTSRIIQTRQPLVLGTWEQSMEYGAVSVEDGDQAQSQSWLGVPILLGDQVTGVISVQDAEPNLYNETHVRLMSTLAANLGTAIENARLFDETQRLLKETEQRVAELAIINSVQAALAAELNIQGIYDTVGDKIREIFHNADMGIRIFDPKTRLESFPYTYENSQRLTIEPSPLGKGGFSAHVYRTRETLVINENIEQESEKHGSYTMPGTQMEKSALFVPLVVGDQARGLINLVDMQREHAFNESDVRLLQTLANSMSVALENARLFDETQRLLKETEQRAAELAIINSVQEGLASKLDMQAIYDLVGDRIQDMFNAQSVVIQSYDHEKQVSRVDFAYENGEHFLDDELMPFSIMGKHLISTRQPVVINENAEEESKKYGLKTIEGTLPPKSLIFVPFGIGTQVNGSFSLQNFDREHAFSESDVRLLQTLAGSMGIALENARLFGETQRLLKETDQRAAELAFINSVQAGLASKLEMQSIYELIGEKAREVFHVDVVDVVTYDESANLISMPYSYEKGDRSVIPDQEPYGFRLEVIQSRAPLLVNENFQERAAACNNKLLTGSWPKSVLFVPLLVGDKVKGVISIQDLEREGVFTQSDVRLLQTLANSMSVALENARLFDETQRLLKETEQRNSELAFLNSISEAMSRTLELRTLTRVVGDRVREIFSSDSSIIMLLDRKTNLITTPYEYDKNEGGYIDYVEPFPLGTGLASRVITTGQPLMASTLEEEIAKGAYFPPEIIEKGSGFYSQSWLGVPIMVKDQALGLIALSDARARAFDESQLRLMQTISTNVGVAIENARLFQEEQQRVAELAIINSVQAALVVKLDVQDIYESVGDKIRDIFHNADLSIRIYDPKTNMLHYPYFYENGARLTVESEPLRKGGFSYHVLQSRQTLVVNENMAQVMEQYGSYLLPGTQMVKSAVFVPLVTSNQAYGAINLSSMEREHAFSDADVRLLETLANSMSVALENARLFDETQSLLKETEQRNAELAVINSVQDGLASKLEMQAIYDQVGDKIQSIFNPQALWIASFDRVNGMLTFNYELELGKHDKTPPIAIPKRLLKYLDETHRPLVINQDVDECAPDYDLITIPGTLSPKSFIIVPLITSGQVYGGVSLQYMDRENAFGDSDVRLLSTLTSSMSVALENARLFAETSRLLQETQQRAQELATVNKLSQALASATELNTLIELTGEQMKRTFAADIVYVALLDPQTSMIHFPYTYGETGPSHAAGRRTDQQDPADQPAVADQQGYRRTRRKALGVTTDRAGSPILPGCSHHFQQTSHWRHQCPEHPAGRPVR